MVSHRLRTYRTKPWPHFWIEGMCQIVSLPLCCSSHNMRELRSLDKMLSGYFDCQNRCPESLPGRLRVKHEYHADDLEIGQVYVGYSALLLEDAYLKIDKNTANPGIDLMDDLKFIGTRTEPSGQSCHKNIIYHENDLVPGNIRHMKAAMHGSLSKEEGRVFIERWMREG